MFIFSFDLLSTNPTHVWTGTHIGEYITIEMREIDAIGEDWNSIAVWLDRRLEEKGREGRRNVRFFLHEQITAL